jgi:hypothetical protein
MTMRSAPPSSPALAADTRAEHARQTIALKYLRGSLSRNVKAPVPCG